MNFGNLGNLCLNSFKYMPCPVEVVMKCLNTAHKIFIN